jgi:hypothetical protein
MNLSKDVAYWLIDWLYSCLLSWCFFVLWRVKRSYILVVRQGIKKMSQPANLPRSVMIFITCFYSSVY